MSVLFWFEEQRETSFHPTWTLENRRFFIKYYLGPVFFFPTHLNSLGELESVFYEMVLVGGGGTRVYPEIHTNSMKKQEVRVVSSS